MSYAVTDAGLERLRQRITECRLCKTVGEERTRVCGVGSAGVDCMIIGEVPSRLGGDITGVPFTKDRSGKLLREMLREVGLDDDDVYITNIVKCNMRDAKGCNRPPNATEIENCRPFYRQEIELVSPKVIVTLGGLATQELLGTKIDKMEEMVDRPFYNGESIVFPMYHPGYVARRAKLYPKERYLRSFARLRLVIDGLQI